MNENKPPTPTAIDRAQLSREDFDALVTGELTHHAIWLEDELQDVICDFFAVSTGLRGLFKQLVLRREGFSLSAKIDLVNSILGSLQIPDSKRKEFRDLLRHITEFKDLRNMVAHGLDLTEEFPPKDGGLSITIETVARSGKLKYVTITPDTHDKTLETAESLLNRAKRMRTELAAAKLAP
jgi:hypothetical protein